MKIMSVNSGSSSLKFQLIDMTTEKMLCSGLCERIGNVNSIFTIKTSDRIYKQNIVIADHRLAIELSLKKLIELSIIQEITEIKGIGYRIVQGGELFPNSIILTDENLDKLESLNNLAPLHNPVNILGARLFKQILPKALHVGVFDTSFHQTIKASNFLYAVPYEWYKKYQIRKYGAHGTSCRFIVQEAQRFLEKSNLKLIICHAGNGVSITAVNSKGESVDTSMGVTPLAGVPMGTRSGDIDPAIVALISSYENKTSQEVINDLNNKSGLLGISGISNDCRDLEKAMLEGNVQAKLALEIQIKKIVDYIASYYVALEGIDALVFTAGVGENSIFFRSEIISKLAVLNIFLEPKLNENGPKLRNIASKNSIIPILIIPTNEELTIARDVISFISNKNNEANIE
ncbi:acetate kinase ['Crotalaria aegyptiaca' phytoplasma]|uniref:Acetate kinase n=1 Tax=Candidatus Phytoplasma crotalariae TaxID=2982627 RepID=A0ABT9D339_9MOLU|nr:acetate kinase ['Crotalaria aegyptiaca' phytoplasma]MDO8059429.1 acetate kinase ['Crotalaria aegyptiaca' phytoplasma]